MLDTITFCSVLQKSDFYSTHHLSGYKVWQHTECLKMKNSTYLLVYEFYTKIWVWIFLLHRIEQLWNDESKKKNLAFLIFFTFSFLPCVDAFACVNSLKIREYSVGQGNKINDGFHPIHSSDHPHIKLYGWWHGLWS